MQLPTLIEGMDFSVYLADPMPEPSLTSSLVRALLDTAPRKVWHQTPRLNKDAKPETKSAFDLGSAAHRYLTGTGAAIVPVDAKDWRTKAAKDARDQARAAGKTPILVGDLERLEAMTAAAREQVADNPDVAEMLTGSRRQETIREGSVFWKEDGVLCRCRPDFYHPDTNTIVHYKTTGTDLAPFTLARFAANAGWDMTAAHYEAGIRALSGERPRQIFAIQETEEPHLMLFAELDAAFLANAMMRRQRALSVWGRCLAENVWPGMISRTVRLECPEWHERNIIAQKDAEQAARDEGVDLLDLARHWQAPEGWQPPAVQGERRDEKDMIE